MKTAILLFLIAFTLISCTEETPQLVINSKSELGEGAIWNPETQQLWWVNITAGILNIYSPKSGINVEIDTEQMIGTVVPSTSGKAIGALQNGIYQIDINTGEKQLIVDPEPDITDNRFNDGKCDPAGRLWAGTISTVGKKKNAALYRIDGNGNSTKMLDDVTTSNGIVWSNDHKTMYYIDTATRKVMAYDFDIKTGDISNPRVAVEVPEGAGWPDGMSIDARGDLWVALWGGFAVACFNPETGELIRKIELPAKNVSSCAFGDKDLQTLYITTARQGMSEEELEKYPLSGGLFKVRLRVKGVPAYFFKGNY